MQHKDFAISLGHTLVLLGRVNDMLKIDPAREMGYGRQPLMVLMRLYLGGRARLKDIAIREGMSAPNLCATFKKLESDGMVARTIDENDRRNTWYNVTPRGAARARKLVDFFYSVTESAFRDLSQDEEAEFKKSLDKINEILTKVVSKNA